MNNAIYQWGAVILLLLLSPNLLFSQGTLTKSKDFPAENGLAVLTNYTINNVDAQDELFKYQAAIKTEADFLVPSGKTTQFESCNIIYLQPGFHATEGASFRAKIEADCLVEDLEVEVSEEATITNKEVLTRKSLATTVISCTPNPFQSSTTISYDLQEETDISLQVFDLNGRLIKELVNGRQGLGSYQVTFDGKELPSAVYYVRLQTAEASQTMKLIRAR